MAPIPSGGGRGTYRILSSLPGLYHMSADVDPTAMTPATVVVAANNWHTIELQNPFIIKRVNAVIPLVDVLAAT